MSTEFRALRVEQLQEGLAAYASLLANRVPAGGWLKEIRQALGRTERQQAGRLGISGPSLHKSEQSEADERITLGQLRKLANGLDCELVYALVPRRSLPDMVRERARELAEEEVYGVAHTMSLENQRPADSRIKVQVLRRTEELLRGNWSGLWR
ncbi:MAG: mobile mystery protein A [Pseudomonadota bacterium]|nr:mobile mystery protein A [Pseudomonadota bacterium]